MQGVWRTGLRVGGENVGVSDSSEDEICRRG
jgi:hypothetical protein